MATLVLGAAATAFSGSIGASPLVSALISGAAGVAGAYADGLIAGALTPARRMSTEGPRIGDLRLQTSTEGAPVADAVGRVRLAGQVIWATRLRMEVNTSSEKVGGKGGGGRQTVTTTTYSYFANFAVGLCEGPIAGIGRVWADGKILDLSRITHRVHAGTADQLPDPLISAKEGAAPAYRGTALVVFEDLFLGDFGNRIPQLEFEVIRKLPGIEEQVQGMVMIPGAGEWVYAGEEIRRLDPDREGTSAAENVNNQVGGPDWAVAVDSLQRDFPNAASVLLVVSWFGSDLRCGACEVRPGVEFGPEKTTAPRSWQVHGLGRDGARLLARSVEDPERPAYGGTPADSTVVDALRDLKRRGISTTFCPFLLMDIAPGNGLADPYGRAEQPAFPWRGRITCHPAAGQPGSVDRTAAAGAQVSSFFGGAAPSDIAVTIDPASHAVTTSYSGPSDWGWRRMVLHYARLCAAVNAIEPGAVTCFLIGSELRGLTFVRDGPGSYPAVSQLVQLAADCRAILGASVKLTYAADWSEYRGHDPADGSGDFFFHLDPLWSSSAIDAVGIDTYMTLSDWRDGDGHLDALAGAGAITDLNYLHANVEGGEDYDWSYQSAADRAAQIRTPITDGAYGKPWVFRAKDIRNWWLNAHHDRPGGVESGSPTGWVPQSKPIWFTEYGFPSVDKATNQPNVFVDPKSSESAFPHFSNGGRDDLIQRRGIEALLTYWDPGEGRNPVSPVYGGPMLDLSRSFLWTWDARPFPAFPNRSDVWGDAANWQFGHWVQGKLGAVTLGALVSHICKSVGFEAIEAGALSDPVAGWLRAGIVSPREQLEQLAQVYRFDMVETGERIVCRPRGRPPSGTLAEAELAAPDRQKPDWTLTRAQETDLPVRAHLGFWDAGHDYRQTSVAAGRLVTSSARTESLTAPLVMDPGEGQGRIEAWLMERWAERERASFALPPSKLAFDPGDGIVLEAGGRQRAVRLTRIVEAGARLCEAVAVEPGVYSLRRAEAPAPPARPVQSFGAAVLEVLDLPVISDTQGDHQPWCAAFAAPWGGVRVQEGSRITASVPGQATMGRTQTDLFAGTACRFDRANRLMVKLAYGALSSVPEEELLERAVNVLAVWNGENAWEILQFATAELVGQMTWQLSGLLRGRRGTAHAMRGPVAAGARVVLLDGALVQADVPLTDRGIPRTWAYGPAPLPSSDPAFKTLSMRLEAVALKPFAPVHVRGARNGAGDLNVTWIRQGRVNATWADGTDVPLGEERELYEIDVLNAGNVIRTVRGLTSPAWTYAASDQTADFGVPQPSITLRVVQISGLVGRGVPTEAIL
ncbi:phage host specificity protein [Roseibium aquae]|uniref:Phage host specificity protein n=2 Tax=Roseibium aquae TaxID=1323746 RepID=A0A916TLC8_9HYPH|nr:glycoside hydrolase/phage tail family protein [Roseibium aquae]GGB54987.1 phage host specificity protein [Roseibium aquae]